MVTKEVVGRLVSKSTGVAPMERAEPLCLHLLVRRQQGSGTHGTRIQRAS